MAGGHRANSPHENASSINLKGVRTENIVVRINVLIYGYVVVRFSPEIPQALHGRMWISSRRCDARQDCYARQQVG